MYSRSAPPRGCPATTAPRIGVGDLKLAAHELAHQWVGDLVTVETWDDLWIKEGMTTLLEYEAARDHIDAIGAGTLNGDISQGGFGFSLIRGNGLQQAATAALWTSSVR